MFTGRFNSKRKKRKLGSSDILDEKLFLNDENKDIFKALGFDPTDAPDDIGVLSVKVAPEKPTIVSELAGADVQAEPDINIEANTPEKEAGFFDKIFDVTGLNSGTEDLTDEEKGSIKKKQLLNIALKTLLAGPIGLIDGLATSSEIGDKFAVAKDVQATNKIKVDAITDQQKFENDITAQQEARADKLVSEGGKINVAEFRKLLAQGLTTEEAIKKLTNG